MIETGSGPSSDGIVLARLTRLRTDRPTSLAVVADPHLPASGEESAKTYKPAEMLARSFDDCDRRGVDYVVSLGDLTKDGHTEEYDHIDAVLDELETPFLSIPGNHDVPKTFDAHQSLPVSSFTRRYADGTLPFVQHVGDLSLIGIDSASSSVVEDSHDGHVPRDQVEWLDDRLAETEVPIVLVHHNLPDAIDQFNALRQQIDPELGTPPVLRDPKPLVDVLSSHDVPLVFSGHLHIPGFATTAGVNEVLVPTTCTFPQAYLLVNVDEAGTTVRYVPTARVSESEQAHVRRRNLKPKAAALTVLASARLSSFPLRDDDTSTEARCERETEVRTDR